MKHFKLFQNTWGLEYIPSEFLLKNDYSGLLGNKHIVIDEDPGIKNSFIIQLINGDSNLIYEEYKYYAFNNLHSEDFQEMPLAQWKKLKAFL